MIESSAWESAAFYLRDFRNSWDPLLAIVPRFSVTSSRDMPMPESKIVKVRSFSFVVILM